MTKARKFMASASLIAFTCGSVYAAQAAEKTPNKKAALEKPANPAKIMPLSKPTRRQVISPFVTYWAGPDLTDETAQEMIAGGFNVVWATESEIPIAEKYKLRYILRLGVNPLESFDDPAVMAKLNGLVERVKNSPYLFGYFVHDEPPAKLFPVIGRMVAHLRKLDPDHMTYVNLYPTYAEPFQLGIEGPTEPAYNEHVRRYMETVQPEMISYDHYHYAPNGVDTIQYFLNLGIIRKAALKADVPFMNIVQACRWDATRTPNAHEMRWLSTTSLAYGATGLSHYIYGYIKLFEGEQTNTGQMRGPDGKTTPQYEAAKEQNPQFIAVATQLQPLRSIGAYHVGKEYWGAEKLPANAAYKLEFSGQGDNAMPESGILLGYFGNEPGPGQAQRATHVYVVNLDYKRQVSTTLTGPGAMATFDTATGSWKPAGAGKIPLTLQPGGGVLVKRIN